MTDNSISDTQPEGTSDTKIYIPVSALQTEDGTAPEMGDSVSFQCDGTVNSIDGDNVCVSPTMANGEPVAKAPMGNKSPSKADLYKDVQDSDNDGY